MSWRQLGCIDWQRNLETWVSDCDMIIIVMVMMMLMMMIMMIIVLIVTLI